MLTDLGLQTEEQIKQRQIYDKTRYDQMLKGVSMGCVGTRICENCNHLISDSICLCLGIFTCPNCKFENGKDLRNNTKNQFDGNPLGNIKLNLTTPKDIFDFSQKMISQVQNGNGPSREEIPPELRGKFAVKNWDDPMFTYGIEYGIILGMLNIQKKLKNETHS